MRIRQQIMIPRGFPCHAHGLLIIFFYLYKVAGVQLAKQPQAISTANTFEMMNVAKNKHLPFTALRGGSHEEDAHKNSNGNEKRDRVLLFNSLTKCKQELEPLSGRKGQRLLMYACGPTVYAPSHLGHARTYVQLDVIRRILRDYLHYDVIFVINFTDIDDKIIARAREECVTVQELARRWEREFLKDMSLLGVDAPLASPRVSDHVTEVTSFIQRLQQQGFAYEVASSVYFDTQAFEKAGFKYRRLVPQRTSADSSRRVACAAEGDVEEDVEAARETFGEAEEIGKKDARDFALWKACKPGEVCWESQWGEGRPGWHIECSAMIESTLGLYEEGRIDIHCGGEDLKFPHHDNEIAQSVAYHGREEWCSFFLHTGHLSIEGCKMSKSLKNFITIREALEGTAEGFPRISAAAMRLLFLGAKYSARMDLSDSAIESARAQETYFRNFFHTVRGKLILREGDAETAYTCSVVEEKERKLIEAMSACNEAVHECFLDDCDFSGALHAIYALASNVHKYFKDCNGSNESRGLITSARDQILSGLSILGLGGLAVEELGQGRGMEWCREGKVGALVDEVASFRSRVRDAARRGDNAAVLAVCDEFRDRGLASHGIDLKDTTTSFEWNFEDAASIFQRRALDEEMRRMKIEGKAKLEEERQRTIQAKAQKAAIPPADLFKQADCERFAAFDSDGVPTHGADGEPLSLSRVKKLRKEMEKHKTMYEAHRKGSTT